MFTGEHERMLDDKGRMVVPPTYRPHIADRCFLTRSREAPCVQLYPGEEITSVAARLREMVRAGDVDPNDERRWSASITEVRLDAQGRIPVPTRLREAVGLGHEVVLIGAVNRAEIWNVDDWRAVDAAGGPTNEGLWM